jgi:hypothetical protein
VFNNDVNIHKKSWLEHLHHILMVFQKLKVVNLRPNPSKCCFGWKNITFLRHVVNYEGSHHDPNKVAIVEDFHVPRTIINVHNFLALTRYCKKIILGYPKIAKPFFALIKKECKFLSHQYVKLLLLL